MLYPRAGGGAVPFQLEAGVRGAGGHASAPERFAVLGHTEPDPTGMIKFLIEFTPPALPPGDYSLSVTVRDPTGSSPPARTEAPFRMF